MRFYRNIVCRSSGEVGVGGEVGEAGDVAGDEVHHKGSLTGLTGLLDTDTSVGEGTAGG